MCSNKDTILRLTRSGCKFLYSMIHMTSSHIRLQNTNQPSSCFSKLSWCSQSPYVSLALCLLTRINSYASKIRLRFKFLYSIIHMRSSHIRLQNTNQPSYCFSKLSWCSQRPYESLALCLLTRIQFLRL